MNNEQASKVIRQFVNSLIMGRRCGKTLVQEAIGKAIVALDRGTQKQIAIKGRFFKRRYCPTCHERVKKGGRFCNACGQAYREPIYYAPEPPYHIPTPPPRGYGMSAGIVVFDELHDWKK